MNDSERKSRFDSSEALQAYFLLGVSRTFALTIPALPDKLRPAVSNGYLLCRIIDCIEDDSGLNLEQKKHFATQFIRVVEGKEDASEFSCALLPLLSDVTIPAEKKLIQYAPEVIKITHGFNAEQQGALLTCVQIMGEGMMHYQELDTSCGLQDMREVTRYCYYVAGVVGEMLTQLYCNYSSEIKVKQDVLMKLSTCFGEGLQMTNIIKDVWADQERGACWLPRAEFENYGFDLATLSPGTNSRAFTDGLNELIGVAHQRLYEALDYTLMIPRHETGIRNFCLFAIGMALFTLRKIYKSKRFNSGQNIKISRKTVKFIILLSRLSVRSNLALRILFKIAAWGLPRSKKSCFIPSTVRGE